MSLCCSDEGVAGAANLNQILQKALNPPRPEKPGRQDDTVETGLRRGGTVYRPGDKVMQIRNDYDKEVFNGDIGVISSVDKRERGTDESSGSLMKVAEKPAPYGRK